MLRPLLELLRIPNVFSAVSNIWLGYLLTHPTLAPWPIVLLLTLSSVLLYLAGMVLNDVFDVEIDRRERPQRPIPSGRISLRTATALGWSLLLAGVAAAFAVTSMTGTTRPGVIAVVLALAIVMYDGWSKHTLLGPVGMGLCRSLNVLLGMSTAGDLLPMHYAIAGGIGVYVAGITWLAWDEATTSRRPPIALANLVMIAGLTIVAGYPNLRQGADDITWPTYAVGLGWQWYLLWAIVGFFAVRRALWSIPKPTPQNVQAAVGQALLSMIVIDAVTLYGVRGPAWSVAVVALLIPTLVLRRWYYAT